MASIFSRIAAGEIPSWKVAEDEKHYAFLDINPVNRGHVLVIPRKEEDYIFDMSEADYKDLMGFARKVAHALKAAMPCTKVGMTVIGLDVHHVHVHLVPMNTGADMNFCAPKLTLPDEELKEISEKIAKEFDKLYK